MSRWPRSAITVSNFFFMVGVGLIAAFLPELARPDALGKVSGWGWGFGYVGGLITLALCLAYVQWAQGHGATAQRVRADHDAHHRHGVRASLRRRRC